MESDCEWEESEHQYSGTPPELADAAKEAVNELLPVKSRDLYRKAYNNFMDWCETKRAKSYSENVLLAHFSDMSEKYKASSLWSYYSKLKSTLLINKNVDISKYAKLIAFLKRKSDGYVPKKSKILNRQQILKFVSEAPDDIYLVAKVSIHLTKTITVFLKLSSCIDCSTHGDCWSITMSRALKPLIG